MGLKPSAEIISKPRYAPSKTGVKVHFFANLEHGLELSHAMY